MDPEVVKQLILTAPWGVVIIALRILDIREKADERKERDANATAKSIADRENQLIVGKAYADAINNLASVVGDIKSTVIEHYKNMGITQDLLDMAKARLQEQENKKK